MATQPDTSTVQEVVVAPPEEEAPQRAAIEGRSLGRIAWSRLKKDKIAMGGGIFVVLLLLLAAFAQWPFGGIIGLVAHPVNDYHQNAIDANLGGIPPIGTFGGISRHFLFGVQPVTGRDLFSQILAGAWVSLVVAFLATILSVVIGVTAGVTAGYFGGWIDSLISRTMDLFLAFPLLLFAIALI